MKKLLICLLAVIGFIATAEAQTVVVQNNQGATEQIQDPNIFYINGIPSTQDIGGVETMIEKVHDSYSNYNHYVVFTNYHSFTVTVLYQVQYSAESKKIGSIVLKAGETKAILICGPCVSTPIHEIATITRRL